MIKRTLSIAALLLLAALPAAAQHYTADTNQDRAIGLSELLRVIQFYNTGTFHCQAGTEDGYDPGPGDTSCAPYDADYNTQNWVISLSELLRAIQFYQLLSYHLACGTEDGYAPGPGVDCVDGDTWTILLPGNVPMELAWVPAGSFSMGSPALEAGRNADEGPQREVALEQGFWIGQYELTQVQWEAVMNSENPSFFQGGNRPVEQVSWNAVTEDFLPAMSTAMNMEFRLPTESEWEYACRADSTTRFYWGDDVDLSEIDTYAWYAGNSAGVTHNVGTAGGMGHTNAFALYDMSGGVAEWCEDWYHEGYLGAPIDGSAWTVPAGSARVHRGGAWDSAAEDARSAHRDSADPNFVSSTIGFRVVLGQVEQEVVLGSANAFAILAGSTVTNTGLTRITGDLGVSPGAAVEGFPPGVLIGNQYTGVDSAAGQAKADLIVAFNDAAGRSGSPISLPGNLTGLTLYPGLYSNETSVMLNSGSVTFDAQGDIHAVFILKMGSTLTTGSGTEVILAGGAKANNIYWQVGTSATLGTTSIFKGNILASASITLATNANLEGRALTQIGAVSLDAAVVTVPAP